MKKREHIIVSFLLRDFAQGLIDFFIPIILYIEGYELYLIGFYYVLNVVARLLTHFAIPTIMNSVGIQNTLRISYVMAIPYIIGLSFIDDYLWLFPALAVYSGAMQSIYWVSRHVDMLQVISQGKRKSARDVGNIEIASSIMRIIAPFVGGVIAEYISPEALYGVVFGILVSAALILASDAQRETSHKLSPIRLSDAFSRKNAPDFVANIGVNYQIQASLYAWPLFMYLTIGHLGTVGGVLALGNLAYMAFVYLSTHFSHPIRFYILGVIMRIASFVIRIVANTPVQVASADLVGASGHGLFLSLYANAYYQNARGDVDPPANVIVKEIFGDIGKLFLWLTFTLGMINFNSGDTFDVVFFIAIPMVGLTYLALPSSKKRYQLMDM